MKKHLALIATVALTVSGIAVCSWAQAQDQGQSGSNSQQQSGSSGQMGGQSGMSGTSGGQQIDTSQIRNELGQIAKAATSKDALDDLSKYLTEQDRTRIQQGAKDAAKSSDLSGTIQAFRNDWHSKYNQDFDLSKSQQVAMSNYQILPGTAGMAQPAGGTFTPSGQQNPSTKPSGNQPQAGISDTGQPGVSGQANVGGQNVSGQGSIGGQGASGQINTGSSAQQAGSTMQPSGQNNATVIIPADPQHNLPQVTLTFTNENGNWRLNLPDNVDANKLASSLKDHLYALGQQKNNWPSDANQAYTVAAHHVFAALEGQPVTSTGMTGQQPGMTGGTSGGQTGGQSGQSGQSGY